MKMTLLAAVLTLASVVRSGAQQQNVVIRASTAHPLHQVETGRIAFASKDVSKESFAASDFLTTYEFTNRSELFMTVFLDKPLSQHLPEISPEKPLDELIPL